MKGLFGFIFALLLLAVIGLFYQHNRYQEAQLRFEKQLRVTKQEAYNQCKEEANEQLKREVEYAKRAAWENGYNKGVSECGPKVEQAHKAGYENGQAESSLKFRESIFEMKQAHQLEIQQLKVHSQNRLTVYQERIRHLELEKEHLASLVDELQSAPKVKQVSFSKKPSKTMLREKITQEQKSINYAVLHAIWILPFLAAMIQGLRRKRARKWKI